MELYNHKKLVQGYYNKLKQKENKTLFEEKYICLYESEDISGFIKSFENSKYNNATEVEFNLFMESFEISFIYDEISVAIDYNNDGLEISLYDNKNNIVDMEYDKTHSVNYKLNDFNLLNLGLDKLEEGISYIRNEDRINSLKKELFSIKKIQDSGKSNLKSSLIKGSLFILFSLILIFSALLFKESEESKMSNVLYFIIAIIIGGSLLYQASNDIRKYSTLQKHINKINNNEEESKIKGKIEKVSYYYNRTRFGKQLDYISVKINNISLLISLPQPFYIERSALLNMNKALHEKEFNLTYYTNSNIVNLNESDIYEEIISFID